MNDYYNLKNVQITFKFKHNFTCDGSNLIYAVICDTCHYEYNIERWKEKLN